MKRKRTNWDNVPWTPFRPVEVPEPNDRPIAAFRNSRYQVFCYKADGGPVFGDVLWLSIKTHDRQPRHDWRDMQRIKNEIAGPEFDAVEIFPDESKCVDAANQYHLWVFINGFKLPFGFQKRLVSEGVIPGAKQRPWSADDRPPDALSQAQLEDEIRRHQQRLFIAEKTT